jgi:hypothetical protein
VYLFFGLQGESPENGSFLGFGWRLLGILGPKSSNVGLQRLLTMRKARHWRAFLLLKKEILRNMDCLADDAVLIAPVSNANSLLTGNFTGNFAVSRLPRPISLARNRCAAVTFRAIPYAN